jgi:hypothetical protein
MGAGGVVAVTALLLAAVGVAGQSQGGCTLTLYLNASASSVSMDGSAVVLPIQQALLPAYPEALVGFEGSLALVLPSGPCPSSAAGLEQQLAGATLQTTNATGPLQLYPTESIELQGSTFVTLDLQANQFAVTSQPLAAAPGGGAGAYTTSELRGDIVNGTVLSTSLISTETLPMTGNSAANASAITAAVEVHHPALARPPCSDFRACSLACPRTSPRPRGSRPLHPGGWSGLTCGWSCAPTS